MSTSTPHDPRRDFEPLYGRWTVHHRRLRERLADCTAWDEFGGTTQMWPLLDGLGNVDDNLLHLPAAMGGDYRAATMRAWDPARAVWSIWWLDGRTAGQVDVPMVGGFDAAGDGLFYADEDFRGRPIRVRFLWLRVRSGKPRWEQAFSTDGGQTWETNWEMDFTRAV